MINPVSRSSLRTNCALAVTAALIFVPSARAIVYRSDMTDAQSLALGTQAQFSGTGLVLNGASNESGTGNLILSDWVLTAKHVVTGYSTASFKGIGGTVFTDPNSDMALIHLNSAASGAVIQPSFLGGEAGKLVWLAGLGGHAPVGGTVTYDYKLRAGTNVVREYQNPYLYFDNANTGSTSSVYESSTAPGDSGGPMYQQVGNVWYVVGEVYGAGGQGFIHTPTNPQQSFILNTIRTATGNASFNFTTPVAPTALFWDAAPTTAGYNDGAGTWDIQRTNFFVKANGAYNYQWDNAMANDVTFGSAAGAAGVVTIVPTNVSSGTLNAGGAGPTYTANGVTAHSLTFSTATSGTYTIAAASTAALTLVNNGTTDPTLTANVNAEISAPITGTAATLTKLGTGTLVLSGTNSYTGKTIISAGTLRAKTPAALPGYSAGSKISVASGAGLTVNIGGAGEWTEGQTVGLRSVNSFATGSTFGFDTTGGNATLTGYLGGSLNYAKFGPNTLTLGGTNGWTGNLIINAGTVALSPGSGHLSTNQPVVFNGNSGLNFGGNAQTIGSLTLADGVTATLANGAVTYVAPAGGTLGGTNTTLDASGLNAFVFNQPGQSLAVNGSTAVVMLGAGTAITGSALNVGTGNYGTSTNTATTLTLGQSTTINTDALQIGAYHANGTINISSRTNGPRLTLRGQDGGTSRLANAVIGLNTAGTQAQSGTFDASGATLDARVGNLTIGDYEPATGTAVTTGTFTMGAGTLDASAITLAYTRAANANQGVGTTSGTFNQTGGTVNVGTLSLGVVGKVDNGTLAQTATYALGSATSSATLAARTVTAGAITTTAANTTATRTLNFNNGRVTTLDAVTDLSISGLSGGGLNGAANKTLTVNVPSTGTHSLYAPAGRTITVADSATIAGAGGLLIDGPGDVVLNGSNTYTGATVVTAGRLRLSALARANVLDSASAGLDIQGGRTQFDYAYAVLGTDPVATIRSILTAGYANSFATGKIRSTTAVGSRGLGYADDGAAVTVAATLYGDANLDYKVDFNDFLILQANFGQAATTFGMGNFNYDNVTDFNDFLALQANFGQSLAGTTVAVSPTQIAAMTAFAQSAVPEPAMGLFAITAIAFAKRRRRNTLN